MARQLLRWTGVPRWLPLLLCLPMNACLIPQDDNILEPDLPPALNQRPRIVTENIRPSLDFDLMKNGPNCGPYEFSFYVEDPDIKDDLSVRVYPDFDPQLVEYDASGNPFRDQNRPFAQDYEGTDNVSRIRPQAMKVSFTPSRDTDPFSGKLGRHVIWAVVGDDEVIGGQVKQPRAQDGGFLQLPDGGSPDPRYVDSVRWIVNVEQGDCL